MAFMLRLLPWQLVLLHLPLLESMLFHWISLCLIFMSEGTFLQVDFSLEPPMVELENIESEKIPGRFYLQEIYSCQFLNHYNTRSRKLIYPFGHIISQRQSCCNHLKNGDAQSNFSLVARPPINQISCSELTAMAYPPLKPPEISVELPSGHFKVFHSTLISALRLLCFFRTTKKSGRTRLDVKLRKPDGSVEWQDLRSLLQSAKD